MLAIAFTKDNLHINDCMRCKYTFTYTIEIYENAQVWFYNWLTSVYKSSCVTHCQLDFA